jgi:Uncharacterised nucleotidyltransferase
LNKTSSTQPPLSPEAQLLIHCATGDEIGSLNVDWPRMLKLAARHKVQPLLYSTLQNSDAVPPDILKTLQSKFVLNAQQNLRLAAELKTLLNLFQSKNILAVPFKGIPLASAVYGNLSMRAAGDIDLLVPRSDIPAVSSVLRNLGYLPDSPRTEADEAKFLHSIYNYHLGFGHPKTGIVVEPHWNVMPPYYSSDLDHFVTACLSRLTQQDVCGAIAPALTDEDLLLILAVHANRHLWERLSWLIDIAQLTRARPNLDWPLVLNNAAAIGQKRLLLLGLLLSSQLAGAKVPTDILETAQGSRPIRALAAQVTTWLFDDAGAPTGLTGQRFLIRSMDRSSDRLAWIWHQIKSRI